MSGETPTIGATATDRVEQRGGRAERVKARALAYFEGIDTTIPGSYQRGFVDIETAQRTRRRLFGPSSAFKPLVCDGILSTAKVNGKVVAEIFLPGQLVEGKVRTITAPVAHYAVHGSYEGIEVSYVAHEYPDGHSAASIEPFLLVGGLERHSDAVAMALGIIGKTPQPSPEVSQA